MEKVSHPRDYRAFVSRPELGLSLASQHALGVQGRESPKVDTFESAPKGQVGFPVKRKEEGLRVERGLRGRYRHGRLSA